MPPKQAEMMKVITNAMKKDRVTDGTGMMQTRRNPTLRQFTLPQNMTSGKDEKWAAVTGEDGEEMISMTRIETRIETVTGEEMITRSIEEMSTIQETKEARITDVMVMRTGTETMIEVIEEIEEIEEIEMITMTVKGVVAIVVDIIEVGVMIEVEEVEAEAGAEVVDLLEVTVTGVTVTGVTVIEVTVTGVIVIEVTVTEVTEVTVIGVTVTDEQHE